MEINKMGYTYSTVAGALQNDKKNFGVAMGVAGKRIIFIAFAVAACEIYQSEEKTADPHAFLLKKGRTIIHKEWILLSEALDKY
jgi:hypothetical protein